MKQPTYPSLYQINTRVWLTDLSAKLGRRATLDDIPDVELDRLSETGFDWIWLLSVWSTGELGRKVSLEHPAFRRDFLETLEDLCDDDIGGSGFAISEYKVHPDMGGDDALKRLHARLRKRGLKLMLDFVPNHLGPDHQWVQNHPDYFISGTEADLEKFPQNYTHIKSRQGELIIAYGRDPYFSGWPDTVQLDYSNPATVEAMMKELFKVAEQCDGVRCDMAMLILPEVFERTWGRRSLPFWPFVISTIHQKFPDFLFLAEVYWNMEWALQQLGFDYAYDKRLYDRLCEGNPQTVREHFYAGPDYQNKLTRFLENHDEPRISCRMDQKKQEAAAIITFLSPGLRFFHQGQFEGRRKRISPHLIRCPQETINPETQKFYTEFLSIIRKPVFRDGQWKLLRCTQAWEGNDTWNSFIVFAWEDLSLRQALVVVNYAPHSSQCFVHLPFADLGYKTIQFRDTVSAAVYDRDYDDLVLRGLYLDLPAWGYHIFEVGQPLAPNEEPTMKKEASPAKNLSSILREKQVLRVGFFL